MNLSLDKEQTMDFSTHLRQNAYELWISQFSLRLRKVLWRCRPPYPCACAKCKLAEKSRLCIILYWATASTA